MLHFPAHKGTPPLRKRETMLWCMHRNLVRVAEWSDTEQNLLCFEIVPPWWRTKNDEELKQRKGFHLVVLVSLTGHIEMKNSFEWALSHSEKDVSPNQFSPFLNTLPATDVYHVLFPLLGLVSANWSPKDRKRTTSICLHYHNTCIRKVLPSVNW